MQPSTERSNALPTSFPGTGSNPGIISPYTSRALASTVGLTTLMRIFLGISKATHLTKVSIAPLVVASAIA